MTTDQGNSCRLTAVEAFNTCREYLVSMLANQQNRYAMSG